MSPTTKKNKQEGFSAEDKAAMRARARELKADVFLAPHPEMYGMAEKRAQMRDGAPNPFVKEGEFNAYAADLETKFEAELAKQTAAQVK